MMQPPPPEEEAALDAAELPGQLQFSWSFRGPFTVIDFLEQLMEAMGEQSGKAYTRCQERST